MTKQFDELNETFDVAADIVAPEPAKDTPKVPPTSASSTDDVKKDYEYYHQFGHTFWSNLQK